MNRLRRISLPSAILSVALAIVGCSTLSRSSSLVGGGAKLSPAWADEYSDSAVVVTVSSWQRPLPVSVGPPYLPIIPDIFGLSARALSPLKFSFMLDFSPTGDTVMLDLSRISIHVPATIPVKEIVTGLGRRLPTGGDTITRYTYYTLTFDINASDVHGFILDMDSVLVNNQAGKIPSFRLERQTEWSFVGVVPMN